MVIHDPSLSPSQFNDGSYTPETCLTSITVNMTPTPLGFEALNHSIGQDHEKEADNILLHIISFMSINKCLRNPQS